MARYSKVDAGLYKIGEPDKSSPVFVSANYTMSFNKLRSSLKDMNAWILVLDTKGINVWCAAGKGTFGTNELIKRIKNVKLNDVVTHNKIIVPQLGAPGVAAHVVKKETGFTVIYGPVRSNDIKTFLDNNLKATKEMRSVRFDLLDRIVLIPVEIKSILLYTAILSIFFYAVNYFTGRSAYIDDVSFMLLLGVGAGTILSPILLPYVPVRAFALKGYIIGLVTTACYIAYDHTVNLYIVLGSLFLFPAISSYITLNFTGASTYTSLSGVKKEMSRFLPLIIVFSATGLVLILVNLLSGR